MKFKCVRDQEFVVGGFTSPQGSRIALGALLLGYYDGRDLVYAGKVGTGFDDATLRSLHERLSPIELDTPPFTRGLVRENGARWVRPELVAQIGFTEWTRDGKLRHPRYQGLRIDKRSRRRRTRDTLMAPNRRRGHPSGSGDVPGKDKITKRDLVDYYADVADAMLPHLQGSSRSPCSGSRAASVKKDCVQQDFADSLPDWMSRVEVAREGEAGGTLVHPLAERPRRCAGWPTRTASPCTCGSRGETGCTSPTDWCSTSTHPTAISPWCVRRPDAMAGVLDDLGLARYVQTTGSRGLHVVVPLRADTDFDTARQFARDVAEVVVADDPSHRTVEARKDKRGDRVYLDVMRNAYAQTAVAPYSVRARAGRAGGHPAGVGRTGRSRPAAGPLHHP